MLSAARPRQGRDVAVRADIIPPRDAPARWQRAPAVLAVVARYATMEGGREEWAGHAHRRGLCGGTRPRRSPGALPRPLLPPQRAALLRRQFARAALARRRGGGAADPRGVEGARHRRLARRADALVLPRRGV